MNSSFSFRRVQVIHSMPLMGVTFWGSPCSVKKTAKLQLFLGVCVSLPSAAVCSAALTRRSSDNTNVWHQSDHSNFADLALDSEEPQLWAAPAGRGWSNPQACSCGRGSALEPACCCRRISGPGWRWDASAGGAVSSGTSALGRMARPLRRHTGSWSFSCFLIERCHFLSCQTFASIYNQYSVLGDIRHWIFIK